MDWKKEGHTWSLPEISRFSFVRPYNWHVQDTNNKDKPVLLLLHGTGASTHSWAPLIPKFTKDFRIIAIDLPGHGFTQTKSLNRSSLKNMADDIISLLIAECIKPKLIMGHSAGAALAFRLAIDIGYEVSGIISINGVLDSYFEGFNSFLFPIAAKALALNPLAAPLIANVNKIANKTKNIYKVTGSNVNESSKDFYTRLFSDTDHISGTLSMMAQWKLERLNNELNYLKQRSLFLIGENDRMVSLEALKGYASKVKGSTIIIEKNLGHLMHEEAPSLIYSHVSHFNNKINSN